jgi:hypothetical protein
MSMSLRFTSTLLVFSVLVVAGGCANRTRALIRRAAPDLQCDEEKVLVTAVDDRIYEARGCGNRAKYVHACDKRRRCGWIRHRPVDQLSPGGDGTYMPGAPGGALPTVRADARVETGRSSSGSKQLKLFLNMLPAPTMLYMIATPGYDAERATLMWRAPKALPEAECVIQLAADGVAVPLGTETKRYTRSDSLDYYTELPYASLAMISESSRVAGRLCTTEVVLSPTQLQKAREMLILVREEQAWKQPPAAPAPPAPAAPSAP